MKRIAGIAGNTKLFTALTGIDKSSAPEATPEEVLDGAIKHENYRKAQKQTFASLTGSTETRRVFKSLVTDHDAITAKAEKVLNKRLSNRELYGRGFTLEPQALRVTASHPDTLDHSEVTDQAIVPFLGYFPTERGEAKAVFAVKYASDSDEPFTITASFDADGETYELSPENFQKFLKGEAEMQKRASANVPIVYFDAEAEAILSVATKAPTEQVVAKLVKAGFDVQSNAWIDACHGPEFGRLCVRVDVPHEQKEEFMRIANEDWTKPGDGYDKRTLEKSDKSLPEDRRPDEAYVDRTMEKDGYDSKDLTKPGEEYNNRTLEKDGNGGKKYENENFLMMIDSKKKAEAAKPEAATDSVTAALETLTALLAPKA